MVVLRQKVCVIGDGTVGKTALIQMAISGGVQFPKKYLMTMGAELSVKEVPVGPDITVELHLFDIAGQEVYKKMAGEFMKGLDWYVAVYDITSKTSFENISRWIDKVKEVNKSARGVIVANKVDLKDKAETTESQGEAAARSHQTHYLPASALRNLGTGELLKLISDETARSYEDFVAGESKRRN